VCIIIYITGEKKEETNTKSQYSEKRSRDQAYIKTFFFYYSEDRRRETHTTRPVFFFYLEEKRKEAHTKTK
jgi:hypothetical protein